MKRKNILALTKPGNNYPGFISINKEENGSITINLRSEPTEITGISICGVHCQPGGENCNGYCTGKADQANPKRRIREAQLSLTAREWVTAISDSEEISFTNPCQKIFDHMFLSQKCVEEGCNYLFVSYWQKVAQQAIEIAGIEFVELEGECVGARWEILRCKTEACPASQFPELADELRRQGK